MQKDATLYGIAPSVWQTRRFALTILPGRSLLMGIVNATPDSFSDGGLFANPSHAIQHAEQLLRDGADILDIGAESTRPGAKPVSCDEELARLMPILTELVKWNVPISVDTYKHEVMQAACDVGVDVLNDVTGFVDENNQAVLQQSKAGAVLMHSSGNPDNMHTLTQYQNVTAEVMDFFRTASDTLQAKGMKPEQMMLDPGFGFAKDVKHNLILMHNINVMATACQRERLAAGVLVGVSRKRMTAQLQTMSEDITQHPPKERLSGSLACALFAAHRGAAILRVHDVKETRQTLNAWCALHAIEGFRFDT